MKMTIKAKWLFTQVMMLVLFNYAHGHGRAYGQDMFAMPHGLRGLTPYRGEPWESWVWWSIAAAALVLALLAGWLWWWKKRPRSDEAARPVPVTRAELLANAHARLKALVPPEPFFDPDVQRLYFADLSMALRLCIEHACGVAASDMTLRELRRSLPETAPRERREDVQAWLEFFQQADAVKFAGVPTDLTQAQRCHTHCMRWAQALVEHFEKQSHQAEGATVRSTPQGAVASKVEVQKDGV